LVSNDAARDAEKKLDDTMKYVIYLAYRHLKEKYERSKGTLYAGKNDIVKLVNSKAPLKQITVPVSELKGVEQALRKNGVPTAIFKSKEAAKFIFFEAHRDIAENTLADYYKEKLPAKKPEGLTL
jgi:hypothetical protein